MSAEEPDREPARIASRDTTMFQLDHVDASDALTVVNAFLTPPIDQARTIADSNSVVVTSRSLDTLRGVRDVLELIDVAPERSTEQTQRSLAALERRVEELEERLAAEER